MEKPFISIFLILSILHFGISCTAEAENPLRMEVDGTLRPLTGPLVFHSEYHDIVFYFPLAKSPGQKTEFRLGGLESEWQKASFPIARYTNLSGGIYDFAVRTTQGNKVIKTYRVNFEIKQDFWEKWWFWVFLVLVVISLIATVIYFWFLYDFRQKLRVIDMRQRIAADLHDEVGANLSSITFLAELARKKVGAEKNDELHSLLEKMSANSRLSASLISDTIWALNPDYDSFEKLMEKMKSAGSEILSSRDIQFRFGEYPAFDYSLTIDQRRDIYLIFKEAINNAAKHSGADLVEVSFEEKEGKLLISVSDNGKGFDPRNTYQGNGLKNYGFRAKGGETEVKIYSDIGRGTSILISSKLENHQN